MNSKSEILRQRIIESANNLIYTKGYALCSFADVAQDLGISKGNLQYHFRSKEAILDAVVSHRLQSIQHQLADWEVQIDDVRERLKRFVRMLLNEQTALMRYGCPTGTLNMELAKTQPALMKHTRSLFDVFRNWLEAQFLLLNSPSAKQYSTHLLSMAQGAALMCFVYEDSGILREETEMMFSWIDSV